MTLPWCDMKIAFGLNHPDRLWRAIESGKATLPIGFSLLETDESGARVVAIFRVEESGFADILTKAREVKATVRRFGR